MLCEWPCVSRVLVKYKGAMLGGFFGSFTTFSSIISQAVYQVSIATIFHALLYIFLTMLGGIACAWGGAVLATRVVKRMHDRQANISDKGASR
jgi:fluoride ion exporter CrcB/FEX